MLYVGLDLSRKRLDFDALFANGELFQSGAVPPDAPALASLVLRLGDANEPVLAVIESMSGARFVHDQLELAGWDVRIADAFNMKGQDGQVGMASGPPRSDEMLGLTRRARSPCR